MPAAVAVTNGGTRLKTPTALPGSAEMLTVDANGQLATQAIPSAGIGGSLGPTANAFVLTSGTGGSTAQGSDLTYSSGAIARATGNVSIAATIGELSLTSGNNLVNVMSGRLYLQNTRHYLFLNIDTSATTLHFDANGEIGIGSGGKLSFSSTTNSYGTADVGALRSAAGVLKISDGSSGFGTLHALLRTNSYTVATLPSSPADAQIAFASNGRKSGEGAGAGTGVFCFSDGGSWYADLYNSVAVAA